MLDKGIIVPSVSEWSSAPVLVRKKDGTVRYCIDFRGVNKITKKDAFPLPNMEECLDTLGKNNFMSTLDMAQGYYQIEVDPDDRHKLAFITRYGLFEFVRMPFGTCNSPATFQRVIQLVLQGLNWKECLAYLDDVIVLGQNFEEHLINLRAVFERFRTHNLKLKPKKCHLFRKELQFLGRLVTEKGVSITTESVKCMAEWPTPKCKKDLEAFLGYVNYHREHIKSFAEIAAPLYTLTGPKTKFIWNKEKDTAFISLKEAMTNPAVLGYPSDDGMFILDTDASDMAIGAELSQIQCGKEVLISFNSKTLTSTQRKYCVTRRELLAVVAFTRHYRYYLLGRPFILRTDHNSLAWLIGFKNIEGQLARWLEELSQYDVTIQHRSGKKHQNADGLSRMSTNDLSCDCYNAGCDVSRLPCGGCSYCRRMHAQWERFQEDVDDVIPLAVRTLQETDKPKETPNTIDKDACNWASALTDEEIRDAQMQDLNTSTLMKWKAENYVPTELDLSLSSRAVKYFWNCSSQLRILNGILFYEWIDGSMSRLLLVVPKSLQNCVLEGSHDNKLAGHMGQQKTLQKVKSKYIWFGMSSDCESYVRTCPVCNVNKKANVHAKAGLGQYHAGAPLERVHIDLMGPFVESGKGNKYILMIVDQFTKWLECYALPDQEAETVATSFVEGFVSRLGCPLQVHSDQGRNFESRLFQEVCKLLQITKTRTTPYRPCSNGQVERYNRLVLQAIRCYMENISQQKDWDLHLQQIAGAIRATVNRQTGFTPNRMMLGREVSQPLDIMLGRKIPGQNPAGYVENLEEALSVCHQAARDNLGEAQLRQKRTYDIKSNTRSYEVGDVVYMVDTSSKVGQSKKLRIQGKKENKVVHHDRLKLCQDRDLPLWLKRLRHSVLHPEPSDKESKQQNQVQEELPQSSSYEDDAVSPTNEGHENESSDDLEICQRPARKRQAPKWMKDFCLLDN
ncbi:uncharacterized protein LOC134264500 [Saccostrea cucullata]|uniref:uncharacterized protein LOC134264500 n=1 Tax=Saccostrea cuccullata TaxID=36930 RepID=UPI002ED4E972